MGFAVLLRERNGRRERLRKRTLERAREAAKALRELFAFQDLYIIGSVLGPRFRLTSDLDMVVSGMDIREFHRAHAFLMETIGGPVAVDLKALEDLPVSMQRRVLEQGVRVA
jgi:predicted nucleotidyltransferase